MRLMAKLGLRVFAVVVKKDDLTALGVTTDPRAIAWEYLLQRLERMSTKSNTPVMLIHDEGEALLVRTYTRKARRAGTAGSALGTGMLRRPARLLVDDPVPRQSHQSYFLQAADLVAYAAFRHVYPPPVRTRPPVLTGKTWEELGDARFKPVSGYKGGPDGLVIYP